MEIKYQSYWASEKKLRSEHQLINRLDLSNKTKYKNKYEDGKITAREIAKLNYEKQLHYELTIFKQDELFCHLVIKGGHIKVNFLDGAGRLYLAYFFSPSVKYNDKIFLDEVWYYNFTSESAEEESYRIHFVFDENGNVNYRKYDELTGKFQDFESSHPTDISGLYEPYPQFEDYESLIRLERNFPLDLLSAQSTKPNDPDEPDNSENKWLPPNWNK